MDDSQGLDDDDNFMTLEYPTSLSHLLKILFRTNEKKLLSLSNPDGYFYLYYIKTCIKFFFFVILISGIPMSYLCYVNNSEILRDQTRTLVFQKISLPISLENRKIYLMALMFTFIVSALAYYMLIEFCNEMSQFEFQPDQQVMDQYI